MLGTSFQKSMVRRARLAMPSGVNSNFYSEWISKFPFFSSFFFFSYIVIIETYLVDILVGTRGTESVETELLVSISLPAHGAHDLNGQ